MKRAKVFIVNKTDRDISIGYITIQGQKYAAIPEKVALRKASYIDRMIKEGKLSYLPSGPTEAGGDFEAPETAHLNSRSGKGSPSDTSSASVKPENSQQATKKKEQVTSDKEPSKKTTSSSVNKTKEEQKDGATKDSNKANASSITNNAEAIKESVVPKPKSLSSEK